MSLIAAPLRALIRKEFLSILRDPKTRVVLIVPPLVQLLIFSWAATLDLSHANLAIYDRDGSAWSQTWTERVAHASFVHRLIAVHDPGQMRHLIDTRQVLAAIVIPADAARSIATRHPVQLQLILDGRRANAGGILLGYLNSLLADDDGSTSVPLAQVRYRYNADLIYRWFVVPGVGGILVTFVTMLLTALSIARERELGTFDQLLVSPCTPLQIIIAKMVPALIIGCLLGWIMVAAAVFGFGVPFRGSLPALMLSLLLYILSVVGIGLMISAVCSTQQQAMLGTFTFVVPSVLMSGFATPTENMPHFLQLIARLIPLKYYLVVLQGSFLKDLPWRVLASLDTPLLLIAAATLLLATGFVRARLQ